MSGKITRRMRDRFDLQAAHRRRISHPSALRRWLNANAQTVQDLDSSTSPPAAPGNLTTTQTNSYDTPFGLIDMPTANQLSTTVSFYGSATT